MAWPSAQACHGTAAPTSRICTRSSGRNVWCTTTTFVAGQHADPHRLAGLAGQQLGPVRRPDAQLGAVQVRVAELEHGRAERVLAALGLLHDQAVPLQRAQHRVHGGLGDVDQLGDLGDAQPGSARRQRQQDLRGGPIHMSRVHLNPIGVRLHGTGYPIMVGIVLISHSRGLAEGAADLAGQVAGGARIRCGRGKRRRRSRDQHGADRQGDRRCRPGRRRRADPRSGQLGAERPVGAGRHRGVRRSARPPRVILADAPFVEGAVAAAVAASAGLDLDAVVGAAEEARGVHKL